MDVLTHTWLTRKLISKQPRVMVAGVGPDVSFYLTYPIWVIAQGKAVQALTTGEWPAPPRWMKTLYHIFHSLPIALAGAVAVRAVSGRWPRQELAAWVLHIIVDIPSHSRRFWGPRFLWPLSDIALDGVPWAEITSRALASALRALISGPCASEEREKGAVRGEESVVQIKVSTSLPEGNPLASGRSLCPEL